jgi:hypothetical protein
MISGQRARCVTKLKSIGQSQINVSTFKCENTSGTSRLAQHMTDEEEVCAAGLAVGDNQRASSLNST